MLSAILTTLLIGMLPTTSMPQQTPQIHGQWICIARVNEATGEDTSYIYTEDVNATDEARTPALYLRCGGEYGLPEMLILTHAAMEPNAEITGTVSFDGEESVEWNWNVSEAGEAIFLSLQDILYFVPAARKASSVAFHFPDATEVPLTFTFSLMGFTRATATLGCIEF